ncbi:hypothetical protein BYT27DRAFT_6604113 [Phlegmacium glaucopus]|nr:hypothetical protein BYT27DRAFT_6604113 [Phlegmacium glaucopus]
MFSVFEFGLVVLAISILAVLTDHGENQKTLSNSLNKELNTTVVILNWSRIANVKKIVSNVCDHLLDDTIANIIIWNNNPNPLLALKDFSNTSCPETTLRIINSPENLYFQARYLACAQATTSYCFIQDDDYFIRPEIIRALSRRIKDVSISGIHLQPPDEMLTSQLRTISIGQRIHTTFAWLGYGTMITRLQAVEFLSLLDKLDVSGEERKMADNYFTILSNTIPERWFNAGMELGGGQPFTVGQEGEERNNRHIVRAAELLDSVIFKEVTGVGLPYISSSGIASDCSISHAPCHGTVCVFETSIRLLLYDFNISVSTAVEILDAQRNRYAKLGPNAALHYVKFPPSHAVDGQPETAFRSPGSW